MTSSTLPCDSRTLQYGGVGSAPATPVELGKPAEEEEGKEDDSRTSNLLNCSLVNFIFWNNFSFVVDLLLFQI